MAITATSTVEMVREKFPQAIVETIEFRNEQTIILKPEHLVAVCSYLQKNLQYTFLSSVTAVDWPERIPRFDVPEPHWGGQVPYDSDPGVGSQTLRTPDGRELNESRSKVSQNQEPGTNKR